MTQSQTPYLGMVVVKKDGAVLAEKQVEGRPSAADLASLLVQAMSRPLSGEPHRPRRLHVRGHNQWQELFPHLKELGISIAVHGEMPKLNAAFQDHLRSTQQAHRAGMGRPTPQQEAVEKLFPTVATWVRSGHIEIGDQEGFGFVVRALDYGGVAFEDDRPATLAEALATLEKGIAEWVRQEGIDLGE
jgi:hypothetical protein